MGRGKDNPDCSFIIHSIPYTLSLDHMNHLCPTLPETKCVTRASIRASKHSSCDSYIPTFLERLKTRWVEAFLESTYLWSRDKLSCNQNLKGHWRLIATCQCIFRKQWCWYLWTRAAFKCLKWNRVYNETLNFKFWNFLLFSTVAMTWRKIKQAGFSRVENGRVR